MALFFCRAKFTSLIMRDGLAQLVERHTSVEVVGSNPILVLFYFLINQERGILRRWSEI